MASASSKPRAPSKPVRARNRRSGIRNNEAGHETRARLLDAAEQLFAELVVDGDAVRNITRPADDKTEAK